MTCHDTFSRALRPPCRRIHALRGDARQWSAQAGYKGAIAYGNFLLQSLKNRAFQQTMLDKTPDTYKDWWYDQPDPLHYIKKEI